MGWPRFAGPPRLFVCSSFVRFVVTTLSRADALTTSTIASMTTCGASSGTQWPLRARRCGVPRFDRCASARSAARRRSCAVAEEITTSGRLPRSSSASRSISVAHCRRRARSDFRAPRRISDASTSLPEARRASGGSFQIGARMPSSSRRSPPRLTSATSARAAGSARSSPAATRRLAMPLRAAPHRSGTTGRRGGSSPAVRQSATPTPREWPVRSGPGRRRPRRGARQRAASRVRRRSARPARTVRARQPCRSS